MGYMLREILLVEIHSSA